MTAFPSWADMSDSDSSNDGVDSRYGAVSQTDLEVDYTRRVIDTLTPDPRQGLEDWLRQRMGDYEAERKAKSAFKVRSAL